MKNETLLVTGASGNLGKLVLNALLKGPKRNIIATSRNVEKLSEYKDKGITLRNADFANPDSLVAAFQGADRLLLISTDAVGSRVAQHKNAIDAAVKAGVKHIIYTSLPQPENSPGIIAFEHHETEKLIRASGLGYTFLRNNLYADNFLQSAPTAIAMGALIGTSGSGKTAYVTRQDCADTAAGALAASETENVVIEVTGPEAVGYEKVASVLSELSNKKIPYMDLPEADFKAALTKSGLPEAWADVYVAFDLSSRQGSLNAVTNAVEKYAGHKPQSLQVFFQENKAALLK
jgi:NAD(P)H dehydrogenase (quinone)